MVNLGLLLAKVQLHGSPERCIVMGCPNPVVRVLVHKHEASARICLCQFHGERAMKYMTDEQVHRYVFPPGQP